MRIGQLDQRITVKRATAGGDDGHGGQLPPTNPTIGTIWASVEAVTGQQRVIADKEAKVQTYRITVHNIGTGAAIKHTDTIVWAGEEKPLDVVKAPGAGRAKFREIEAQSGKVIP